MKPDPRHLAKAITAIYSGYVLGTESFLNSACGPIITKDSDLCKKDFLEVARKFF